jgi:hypothetical protein
MNKTFFVITCSLALLANMTVAQTAEQMEAMKRCMAQEQSKSDETRGGLTAREFCAAVVASGDY